MDQRRRGTSKINRCVAAAVGAVVLALNINISDGDQRHRSWNDLGTPAHQGLVYRLIDNETVVVEDTITGRQRTKMLAGPTEDEIYLWAQSKAIPILEIDPRTIDTTEYLNWYTYWASVPLSNLTENPPLAGDVDHNGRWDFYGLYRDSATSQLETRIYELNSFGQPVFRAQIVPRHGHAEQFMDVDRNGLVEVLFWSGDSSVAYEQVRGLGLPTRLKFVHSRYDYPGTAILTNDIVMDLDGDSLDDFLYRGSFPDSAAPNGEFQLATFVAEYDSALGNFRKVWKTQLRPPPGESGIGGYDVGDYDGDGRMNFLATGAFGEIWVLENAGDDSNVVNWTDTIPFVNMYYNRSGDVDNDGKREFFVSATMSSGNWITVYEADSNDSYSARFIFRLLSGGSLDDPTLLTRDVDGDGKLEFTVLSGADLFIFKGDGDDSYKLWYYKLNDAKHSIQYYDFNADGWLDFIISKEGPSFYASPYFHSDIFLADKVITGVDEEPEEPLPHEMVLFQNYPNPFNPTTTLQYILPMASDVKVQVFNISGEKVAQLIDEYQHPGVHFVKFNAEALPTGIYFARVETRNGFRSIKTVLVR